MSAKASRVLAAILSGDIMRTVASSILLGIASPGFANVLCRYSFTNGLTIAGLKLDLSNSSLRNTGSEIVLFAKRAASEATRLFNRRLRASGIFS